MTKSILKKIGASTPENISSPLIVSREDRIRDTAIHHANLLQQRKDSEALILSSIETLLDFPPSPSTDPACPSGEDVNYASKLLKSFQPSDYDSLIEERNINKKCGYLLCSQPNRQQDTNAKYRILHDNDKGTHGLKFVERRMMEQWCSEYCGKRALYVRVQLSDEPAWMRMTGSGSDILFMDEDNDIYGLIEGLQESKFGVDTKEDKILAAMKDLSIERGDKNYQRRPASLAQVKIRENKASKVAPERESDLDGTCAMSDSIEGYTPMFGYGKFIQNAQNGLDGQKDVMHTI